MQTFESPSLPARVPTFTDAVNKLKNVVEKEGRMLTEVSGINSPIEVQKIEECVKQVLEEVKKTKGKSG